MSRLARRNILRSLGLAAAGLAVASRADAVPRGAPLLADGAANLRELMARLAKAPRRRDFKSVPMILDDSAQWDHAALAEVIAYRPVPKQVWDNSQIDGGWLGLMRNALNTQIWSFKHPDFLAVSATHGSASLALYDAATWDKYRLAEVVGPKVKASALTSDKVPAAIASADMAPAGYENPRGVFGAGDNSIPLLMRRGVVFLTCHNAIWEHAGGLIEKGINPDKLAQDTLAAELTNHLAEGVVLTPGAVATIAELQQAGFHYIK